MTGPTARDRAILRAYGTWEVVDILLDPDHGITRAKGSMRGCSHYRVGDDVFWMQVTSKGITLMTAIGTPPVETLTWATARSIAAETPQAVLARLEKWRAESREATRNYPIFRASAKASGCGMPSRWVHPLTEAQALYAAEYDAWERDHKRPAIALKWRLDAEREALLDEALSREPADLLDLLGALV